MSVNVGAIGHTSHGKHLSLRNTVLGAIAAVAIGCAVQSTKTPAPLPPPLRFAQPKTDLNGLLPDPGRQFERAKRKADRKQRLASLQRKAAGGAS